MCSIRSHRFNVPFFTHDKAQIGSCCAFKRY
jgi:hypothetical protein